VTGDLALLHDSNGFLGETEIDLCIVVIDNDGGGLFDALPQAAHAPQYERLFVTPPARDLAKLAAFHGLAFSTVSERVALADAAGEALDRGGLSLIRVPVNRALDRRLRAQLGD
jgi:2-succinyl-5-enolpyruvyl-6-hydroxy-3-cyclohexene-1-carboxylate synthase